MTLPRPVFPSASFFQPSLLLACAATLAAGLATQGAQAQSPPRAVQPVQAGASAPCAQGLVKLGPGAQVGTVTLCSEVERQVPQLGITLAQLQKQLSGQDQVMAEMLRLLRQVNAASVLAGQQQIEMARSLEKKLAEAATQPPAASLRSVRALGDEIEQVVEELDKVAQDSSKRKAYQSLQASIQQSIGALELKNTAALLGSVDRIQKSLDEVGSDVKIIKETGDETRDIALFAEAKRTRARGDQGHVRVLGTFVARGRSFEREDLAGMGFSQARAPGLKAPDAELMLTWWDGAELSQADLRGASLIAARLERAQLAGANLAGTRALFARAEGANLNQADLGRSNWSGADLRNTDLRGAKLVGASLAHADLREADLRGADLTGAFLGNADLRGARLEGAVLRNTDATLAVLPRTALSPAQYAGLCGTPSPAQYAGNVVREPRPLYWRVIERIPSARYTGGFENEVIVNLTLYLDVEGHRPYPRCQPRAKEDLPEWDPPVWSMERQPADEAWSESLSFRAEHAVLDTSRRRAELRGVMSAVRNAAAVRSKALAELPQFADIHVRLYRLLDERLAALTRPVPVPATLNFDPDTALLWMLRLQPEWLERIGLEWANFSRRGQWGALDLAVARADNAWPRLYPAELQQDAFSDTTSRAFQTWTRARAAAVGRTPVTFNTRWDALKQDDATWSHLLGLSALGDPAVASRLGASADRVLVHMGNLGSTYGRDVVAGSLVVIEGDMAALAAWAARQPPKAEQRAQFTVQGLRWLPREAPSSYGPYLVWTLRLSPQPERSAGNTPATTARP